MRSELDLQIDDYLRDPADFPAEFMWWIRRLIEDTAGPTDVDASAGTGVNGIDFNKENITASDGSDASYLWLQYPGVSPLPWSLGYGGPVDYGDLVYLNRDEGTGGQMIVNNGGGVIGLDQSGDGVGANAVLGSINAAKIDGAPAGGTWPNVGIFAHSAGVGAVYLKNDAGPVILDSRGGPILFFADGQDINQVSIKISTLGNDFLVQGDQAITRNGSGVITAITPTHPALRITTGSTNAVFLYSLPTSSAGLASGQVWNSSGVLHIV